MAFNAEYVGTSTGEIYSRNENAPQQTITEVGDAFYEFLTNYRVNGIYTYKYGKSIFVTWLEIKLQNVLQMERLI